jgi:hypothetical protein
MRLVSSLTPPNCHSREFLARPGFERADGRRYCIEMDGGAVKNGVQGQRANFSSPNAISFRLKI